MTGAAKADIESERNIGNSKDFGNLEARHENHNLMSTGMFLPLTDGLLMGDPFSSLVLCSVVAAELYYGVMKSSAPAKNLARLTPFLDQFVSLPFDSRAAQHFGQIRAALAKVGTPIGPYDLQIAAISLANKLTVVTHNTLEFSRITGLKFVDWE